MARRTEPRRRRAGRARPRSAASRAARGHRRDVRRSVRARRRCGRRRPRRVRDPAHGRRPPRGRTGPADELSSSAATAGFADTLLQTIGGARVGARGRGSARRRPPALVVAYRDELEASGSRIATGCAGSAVERLRGDLDAWPAGSGVRVRVRGSDRRGVGAPRGAGRSNGGHGLDPVRAGARRVRGARADGRRPRRRSREASHRRAAAVRRRGNAALAHLERELFADEPAGARRSTGRSGSSKGRRPRNRRAARERGRSAPLRGGLPPSGRNRLRVPDRWRAPLEAPSQLQVPYAIEHGRRLGDTPLGRALISVFGYAWLGGGRGDLFAFLRSPFSGLERRSVDFVEGRLEGRADRRSGPRRRGERAPARRRRAGARRAARRGRPGRGASSSRDVMVRNAWGLESPPTSTTRASTRAPTALPSARSTSCVRSDRAASVSSEDVVAALERTRVPPDSSDEGQRAVLDHERARTRPFDVVLRPRAGGGCVPAPRRPSPLLERRRSAGARRTPRAARRRRSRPLPLLHDLHACAQRLVLVREAAGDEGTPREPSPFWEDVRSLFDEADGAARDAAAAAVGADLAARVRAERARAPARARPARCRRPRRRVRARGRERLVTPARPRARCVRSRDDAAEPSGARAVRRQDRSRRPSSSASRTARRPGSSSASIDPKKIDAEPDPILRGQVLHTTLHRFYAMLPRELDAERVTPENLEAAIALVHRCLDDALESGVRLELTELQAAELRTRSAPTSRDSCATRPRPTSDSSRDGSRSRSAPSARP